MSFCRVTHPTNVDRFPSIDKIVSENVGLSCCLGLASWTPGQILKIPIDEARRVRFLQGIGSGLEETRVHAGLIHFDDLLVFGAGGFPQPCQPLDIVVHAFDRLVVHQPKHFHFRMVHGSGNEPIDHTVIGVSKEVADGSYIEIIELPSGAQNAPISRATDAPSSVALTNPSCRALRMTATDSWPAAAAQPY